MRPNVIITHGLGKHPPDFYKKLEKRLKDRVDCNVIPFYYHDLFQEIQEENYEHYELLGNQRLRRFVFENVADGVTYAQPKIYDAIHNKLHELLYGLTDSPLVIIAPSLGGQVMLDHIWDSQRSGGLYLNNLQLFITNGCNIPLFVSGLKQIGHIQQDFTWLNFYDRQDVLGYPLAPLGYKAEDIQVKTHSWIFSHLRYWSNKKFLDRVASEIGML